MTGVQTCALPIYDVFMPLMSEIGLLWQSDTISPAHEHFITYLIKQKLLINTEKLQYTEPVKNERIFILFLPLNEIHELGLMYLNYEFILNGYKTIYLGESVPTDSLIDVLKYFDNLTFVSYLTVQPDKNEVNKFIKDITKDILIGDFTELWLIGRMTQEINISDLDSKVKIFNSIQEMASEM